MERDMSACINGSGNGAGSFQDRQNCCIFDRNKTIWGSWKTFKGLDMGEE